MKNELKRIHFNQMLCFFTLACSYHTSVLAGSSSRWWFIDQGMDSLYLNWDEKDKDDKDYSKSQEIERCNSDVDMKLFPKYEELEDL